jgi:hypothetical protein
MRLSPRRDASPSRQHRRSQKVQRSAGPVAVRRTYSLVAHLPTSLCDPKVVREGVEFHHAEPLA